jgi:phospholipase D1/2
MYFCNFRAGETFRVIVVMPLLPAFEGEMGTETGGALAAITHWNYASISRYLHLIMIIIFLCNFFHKFMIFGYNYYYCTYSFRGKGSIIERLKDAGIENPSDYISFYGLRTHSILNGELVCCKHFFFFFFLHKIKTDC